MLVFMVAAVACAIVAFYFLGYLIRLFHNRDPNDTELGLFGFLLFLLGFYGAAACFGTVLCIRQVLRPFSQDLHDLSRDKLVLEF